MLTLIIIFFGSHNFGPGGFVVQKKGEDVF